MTNEELVFLIQNGNHEHILALWQQVERFIKMKANSFYHRLSRPRGVTPDDLVQVGFFAVLDASKTFSTDKDGNFLTWLDFYLKTNFYEAAGIRTQRDRRDPIESALSLDQPLNDGSDDTFADVVADPANQFEAAEASLWRDDLRRALDNALNKLPKEEADIIRLRFFDDLTMNEAGDKIGVSAERVRQLQQKGFRKLRNTARKNGLETFIDDVTSFYARTNFSVSMTSPTELTVIRREEIRERAQEMRSDQILVSN